MCSISVVHDYMTRNTYVDQWTRPMVNEYQEIIRRLDALDKKLGQPECDDPSKAEFLKRIDERLRRLEEQADVK